MNDYLPLIWYSVLCISVIFYIILDGFDLGVGCLHLFGRSDQDRRVFLNSIGPVWDGNEVWLIIIFGGMFAGFPAVYSTICSVFYTIMMAVIAGLMFRAVAIEFRSKHPSHRWRRTWDILFSVASFLIAFLIGVVLANLIHGLPLKGHALIGWSLRKFFSPYAVLVGVTGVSLFMMHGTIYLLMKTEGELHNYLRRWVKPTILFFVVCYILTTLITLVYEPHMIATMKKVPWLFAFAVAAVLTIANIPRCVHLGKDGMAFISSSLSIALLFMLFGIGTFPNFLRSTIDPQLYSLTFMNSAASTKTLQIILTVAVIGVPLVLAYGFWIYRIFRGKVRLDDASY